MSYVLTPFLFFVCVILSFLPLALPTRYISLVPPLSRSPTYIPPLFPHSLPSASKSNSELPCPSLRLHSLHRVPGIEKLLVTSRSACVTVHHTETLIVLGVSLRSLLTRRTTNRMGSGLARRLGGGGIDPIKIVALGSMSMTRETSSPGWASACWFYGERC